MTERLLNALLAEAACRDTDDPFTLVYADHLAAHEIDVRTLEQRLIEWRDLPRSSCACGELVEHRREGEAVVTINERHAWYRTARPVQRP